MEKYRHIKILTFGGYSVNVRARHICERSSSFSNIFVVPLSWQETRDRFGLFQKIRTITHCQRVNQSPSSSVGSDWCLLSQGLNMVNSSSKWHDNYSLRYMLFIVTEKLFIGYDIRHLIEKNSNLLIWGKSADCH